MVSEVFSDSFVTDDRDEDGCWCDDCGSTTIGLPTDGADEVLVEAVYWRGWLVGATVVHRSRS